MSKSLRTLGVITLLLAFSLASWAAMPAQKVILNPDGSITSDANYTNPVPELDTVWPDSIYYCDPDDPSSLYTSPDLWSGVRFTAPANFIIEGVRFLPLNQYDNFTDECEVYVYSDNDGQPGEDLADGAIWQDVLPAFPDWVEVVLEEADYINIDEAASFWIIYGPAPGGTYGPGGGWWNLVDSTPVPGERSKMADALDGAYEAVGGDFLVIAEGEVEPFFDLVAVSAYNDIQKFHVTTNDVIQYAARVTNPGNLTSPAFTVNFTIEDDMETVYLNETVEVDPLDAEGDIEVLAPITWTPLINARHILTVTVTVEGDPDNANNTTMLLQNVIEIGDWYSYDDGTFESATNFSDGNGWATAFKPVSYPGIIDSANFFFNSEEDAADLQLWTIVDDGNGGLVINQIWTNENGPVVAEWNTIAVNSDEYPDGFSIQEGDFVLMHIFANGHAAYPKDDDLPTSAQNGDMPKVSYQVAEYGQEWYFDQSGNWGMRARIGAGTAPDITIAATEFDFGDVVIGNSGTVTVTVQNDGTGRAIVDSIRVGLAGELSVEGTPPFIIEAGQTGEININWTPVNEGPINNTGTVAGLLYHNDVNLNSPVTLLFHGNAIEEESVHEVNGNIPTEYFLSQNFPNPFNPVTGIQFGLKKAGQVNLTVYDLLGRQVATVFSGNLSAGVHQASFDASSFATGMYYYAIEVNGFTSMKKMVLMK